MILSEFLITDYMLHHLHIEENQVPKMCLDLYKEYGTTMAGLKVPHIYVNYEIVFYSIYL